MKHKPEICRYETSNSSTKRFPPRRELHHEFTIGPDDSRLD